MAKDTLGTLIQAIEALAEQVSSLSVHSDMLRDRADDIEISINSAVGYLGDAVDEIEVIGDIISENTKKCSKKEK